MKRKSVAVGSVVIVATALALVGLAPATRADTPLLARYPYLTDLTATSVAVTWATTSADTSPGVVTFGPGTNCAQTVVAAQHAASTYTAFGESTPYYQHSVQLTGLAPSTSYCYRVYSGTGTPGTDLLGVTPQFPTVFTTVPSASSSSSFSFDVLGDFGETSLSNNAPLGTYNQYQAALDGQLAASATAATNPALFALSTGDIAYNDGSTTNYGDLNHAADRTGGAAEQSNVFDARYWARTGSSLPLYSVAGNHGRNGNFFSIWPEATNVGTSKGTYTSALSYPAVDGIAAGKYPSDWYAFTIGGVRFYILDSDWTDVSQSSGIGTGCGSGSKACPSYQVDRDQHWQQTSAEYTWLANDLQQDIAARGSSALRMAVFHYPLRVDQNNYTTQQDVYLQNSAANPNGAAGSLEALLARDNVNLVFNGHAHLYERNVAPLGGVPNYVTGGGGGVPTNVAATCSPTDAYARGWDPTHAVGSSCGRPSDGATAKPAAVAQDYHFLKVTVSGTDVRVDPTDSTGAVFDPMTYHFAADATAPTTPGAPTVAHGTGTASANVTVTLGAAAADNVGVVSYDIYRDGTYVATIPAAVKTWTDVAVAAGTHTWTVAARDQRGNQSTQSASASITIADTTSPTAPTLSAASGPPNEIDLSWSGATDNVGVTGYNVYRDGGTTPVASDVQGTTWADTGLAPGSTHTYTVTAHDAAGNTSAPSNSASATVSDTVPIGSPTGLAAAQSATLGQVAVTWSPPDTGTATSYAVYRNGLLLHSGTATSYTDLDAPDSVAVTYRVVASDAAGNTASASVTITPDWTAPTSPDTVTATATGVTSAKITWTAATDAVGVTAYTITRTGGGATSTVATVPGGTATVTDTTGTGGTAYTYSVVAADAVGNTSVPGIASVTLPVFAEDFESGSIGPPRWTTPTAGLVAQQATVHGGNWAAEETSSGTPTCASTQLPATYRALHVSAWVYIKQRSTSAGLFKLRSASGAYIAYLYVNAAGVLAVRNDAGLVTHASTTTVSTGQWHHVELGLDTNPGGRITIWAALDGTRVTFSSPIGSTETLGSNPIGQLTLGDDVAGRTYDIAIDDISADTNV